MDRPDVGKEVQLRGKRRRLQDDNTENSPKKMSLQRSRLPQPSLKRMRLATTVAGANVNLSLPPVGAVKRVGCSTISLSRLTQNIPRNVMKTRVVTVAKDAGTGPAAPSTAGKGAVAKKRPAWDLKGQLEDMKKCVSDYRDKLQVSDLRRKQFQERAESLSDAPSRIEELEDKLRIAESQLDQLRHHATVREAQIRSLTAEVEELSTALKGTKSTLVRTEQELEQKTICAEEQRKLIGSQEAKLQCVAEKLQRVEEKLQRAEETIANGEQERRRLHNTVQELKGNIRVFCRVRPFLDSESQCDMMHIQFQPSDEKVVTLVKTQESHTGNNRKDVSKSDFSFDRVFQPVAKQEEVFEDISQLVQSALDGYNVCIFAYGQTGSGKTYTMEGPDELTCETKGMIPRAVDQIFSTAHRLQTMGWVYKFTVSYLEIYNKIIRDLLVTKSQKSIKYEIKPRINKSEQLYVTNLEYISVSTVEEVNKLITIAKANRSVAKTAMNDQSSRSHSVFQLHIEGNNSANGLVCRSNLCLVDLAGSERLDKSHSSGDRLLEAQAINNSLSCLALVFLALSNKESHVPYRNSKLTYLLQESLGGNSKTLMFVNVSPLEDDFQESLSALRFASKVNKCTIGTAQMNRQCAL
ncbi:kinesin-like protein KIFC1 [Rhinoraja longicauda]